MIKGVIDSGLHNQTLATALLSWPLGGKNRVMDSMRCFLCVHQLVIFTNPAYAWQEMEKTKILVIFRKRTICRSRKSLILLYFCLNPIKQLAPNKTEEADASSVFVQKKTNYS